MIDLSAKREKALKLLKNPIKLAHLVGFEDMTQMHDSWMRQMLAFPAEDMTLQAHRGSYKTSCIAVVLAIMMIRYRDKNILFMRKTDTDVGEVMKAVERILRTDIFCQMYQALTGDALRIAKATSDSITLGCYSAPRGADQLLGIGIGGSITGKHADIIFTDDIVNLKDRLSPAERERTKATYQELQNIRNRGGRIINTGTPWHKEDCFSIMPPATQYDCYTTGLITPQKLEELRRSMSPSLFAANYELRHIANENAMFKTAPTFTDDIGMLRDGIAHIDAAYGGSDYTAFTCGCRCGDTIYLYGRLWRSHVDTVLDAALADADRLMCAPIYCENNGDKGYLAREIRSRGSEAHIYTERENKHLKISTFLRKWWNNIVFIEGTDNEYIQQITDYTETAEHDDAPDSAACVCRILDRRGE